jgi:hypothetical protein
LLYKKQDAICSISIHTSFDFIGKRRIDIMWILKSTIFIVIALITQLPESHGQNQCTAASIATCGTFPCVQTGDIFSCLCSDFTLKPSSAACNGGAVITTTQSPVVIPNQCANAVCPAGATCIPTNQNPALYICLCPSNIIANPDCPTTPPVTNPCLTSNPCQNGGTCVLNQLTLQAVCVCPTNTYGPNCGYGCRPRCDKTW